MPLRPEQQTGRGSSKGQRGHRQKMAGLMGFFQVEPQREHSEHLDRRNHPTFERLGQQQGGGGDGRHWQPQNLQQNFQQMDPVDSQDAQRIARPGLPQAERREHAHSELLVQQHAGTQAGPMGYFKTEAQDDQPSWQESGQAQRAPLTQRQGGGGDGRAQISAHYRGGCADARATTAERVTTELTGASMGTAQAEDGLKVAPYKLAFVVCGNTVAHKQILKDLGGRWNRPLAAWIYPGPKQETVVAALRAAGITVEVSTEPLVSASTQPAPAAPQASSKVAGVAAPISHPALRHTLSVERYKKALLVKGDTFPVKETLKGLGGKWSGPLGGFIFGGKMKTTRMLLSSLRADSSVTLCVADGLEDAGLANAGASPVAPAAPHPRPGVEESQAAHSKRPKLEHPPEPVEEWITPSDPNKPKRPLSAFFLFSKAKRAQVVSERPEMASRVADVARLAGAEWNTMDQAARAPYLAMAVRPSPLLSYRGSRRLVARSL